MDTSPSHRPAPACATPSRWARRRTSLLTAGGALLVTAVVATALVRITPGSTPWGRAEQTLRSEGPPVVFTTVAAGRLGTQQIVIAGGSAVRDSRVVDDDGRLYRWDLATGDPVGQPVSVAFPDGRPDLAGVSFLTTAQLDGRPVVVSGSGGRDVVQVWDLASGELLGGITSPRLFATMTVTQLEGRLVLVTGSADGTVRVWDLGTGAPVGRPLALDTGTADPPERLRDTSVVYAVAVTRLDGRPVVVAGGARLVDDSTTSGTVRAWDLATGAPVGRPLLTDDGVFCVAVTQLRDRPVVVAGGYNVIQVSDAATGVPVGRPLGAGLRAFTKLAVAELGGRPVIVSADDDTLMTWDLTARFG
jgi:WD40 repeat protein